MLPLPSSPMPLISPPAPNALPSLGNVEDGDVPFDGGVESGFTNSSFPFFVTTDVSLAVAVEGCSDDESRCSLLLHKTRGGHSVCWSLKTSTKASRSS